MPFVMSMKTEGETNPNKKKSQLRWSLSPFAKLHSFSPSYLYPHCFLIKGVTQPHSQIDHLIPLISPGFASIRWFCVLEAVRLLFGGLIVRMVFGADFRWRCVEPRWWSGGLLDQKCLRLPPINFILTSLRIHIYIHPDHRTHCSLLRSLFTIVHVCVVVFKLWATRFRFL